MSDDLNRLVSDLRGAGDWFELQARKLVDDAGERVRDDARRLAPGGGSGSSLPRYADAITYETGVDRSTGTVWAEIGPEKGGVGSLGHILEFGTSRTPPHAHMGPALDMEGPRFEDALAKILDPLRDR